MAPGSNDSIDVSSVIDPDKVGGTPVDTVRPGDGTDHRQIIVLGDPHTIGGVAGVVDGQLVVSAGPTSSMTVAGATANVPVVRALTDAVLSVDNIEFGDVDIGGTVHTSSIGGKTVSALVTSGVTDLLHMTKLDSIEGKLDTIDGVLDNIKTGTDYLDEIKTGTDYLDDIDADTNAIKVGVGLVEGTLDDHLEEGFNNVSGGLYHTSAGLFNVSSTIKGHIGTWLDNVRVNHTETPAVSAMRVALPVVAGKSGGATNHPTNFSRLDTSGLSSINGSGLMTHAIMVGDRWQPMRQTATGRIGVEARIVYPDALTQWINYGDPGYSETEDVSALRTLMYVSAQGEEAFVLAGDPEFSALYVSSYGHTNIVSALDHINSTNSSGFIWNGSSLDHINSTNSSGLIWNGSSLDHINSTNSSGFIWNGSSLDHINSTNSSGFIWNGSSLDHINSTNSSGLGDIITVNSSGLGDLITVNSSGLGDIITVNSSGLGDLITVNSSGLGDIITVNSSGLGDLMTQLREKCLPVKQTFCHENWTFSSDIQALSGNGCLDASSCNPWMGFWFDTIHAPTVRNASCTPEVISDVGNDKGDDGDTGLTIRGSDGGGNGGGIGPPPGGEMDEGKLGSLRGDQNNPDWGENATDRGPGYDLNKASSTTRGGSEYKLEWHGGATSGTVHDIPPDEWYCQHAVKIGEDAEGTELAFNHNLMPIVAPRKAGGVWVAGKEAISKTAFVRLDRPHSVNPPLGWIPNGCKHFTDAGGQIDNSFSGTVRMTNNPFDIRPSENTGFGWSWYDAIALPKTVSATSPSANVSPSGEDWDWAGASATAGGTNFLHQTYGHWEVNATPATPVAQSPYIKAKTSNINYKCFLVSGGYGMFETSSCATVPEHFAYIKDFSSCWAVLSSNINVHHETVTLPHGTVVETPALEPNTEYLITAEVSCVNAGSTYRGHDYSGALFVWGGTCWESSAQCYPTVNSGFGTGGGVMAPDEHKVHDLQKFHSLQSPYVLAKARHINGDQDARTNWGDQATWQDLGVVSSTFKTDASSTNLVLGWAGLRDISQGYANNHTDVWCIRNISLYKKYYNTCKRVVLHGITMDSAGDTSLKEDAWNIKPGKPKGTMTVYDGKYPTNHGFDPHWAGWAGIAFSANPSGPPASALQSYGALNNTQHESNVHAEYRHHGDAMGMTRQTTFDPPVPCHPGYPVRVMCTEEWNPDFTPFIDKKNQGSDLTILNHGVRPSDVYWNGTITYSIETMKDAVAPVMTTDTRNPNQLETPNTDKCT